MFAFVQHEPENLFKVQVLSARHQGGLPFKFGYPVKVSTRGGLNSNGLGQGRCTERSGVIERTKIGSLLGRPLIVPGAISRQI